MSNFPKYQCPCKEDVVQSKRSGHYCSCKCGEFAVDSTEHYTRLIGDFQNAVLVKEEKATDEIVN